MEEVKKEESEEEEETGKKQNKQLKSVFIFLGILAAFFAGVVIFMNTIGYFEYQGVEYYIDTQTMTGMTLYRTSLPVDSEYKITEEESVADYNFYLRNDPRELEDIEVILDEELSLMPNVVINFSGDINCDGDGIIAVANILNVLSVLDVSAIKNETLGCDPEGKYTFLQIQTSDVSNIEQFGPSCYYLNINDCEVLEVTEKYIVEILSEVTENRLS